MPTFVLIGRDGTRGVELRQVHRGAHLENLQKLADEGRIHFAGPLRHSDGTPCGSVVIFDAPDLESAQRVVDSDPYTRQGVFEHTEVFETLRVFPKA